ncbi:hypothetical protein [Haliangium sp. UPWRP_2]|uniref:hypothetical protein n=1 Tax=Haliangium sp. UPWRP_2 TaxID=1931276 RepID=UPI001304F0E2|nr:hypothetical protein [Haliangium sp. UPWRP_2]
MREPIQMNRHRGLAAGQLTRRYRRLRAAATWGIDLEEVELIAEEKRIEESASEYDYDNDYLVYLDPIGGRSIDDFLLEEQQPEVLRTFCSWPRLDSQWPGEVLTTAAWPEPPRPDPDALPATLHAHATQLMQRLRSRTFSWTEHLASAWAFADPAFSVSLEPRTSAMVGAKLAASALARPRFPLCPGLLAVLRHFADCPGSVIMALLFAPFWVRPLSSFRVPDGSLDVQTSALIEHLFVRYPVPRCLLQEWEPARLGNEGALPSLKWVYWLLLLGQGASLQRAAQWFGWRIPARFVHHFVSAPPALQPAEACLWAEVARRGGQPIDFRRLTRWAAYLLDPTDAGGAPARATAAVWHGLVASRAQPRCRGGAGGRGGRACVRSQRQAKGSRLALLERDHRLADQASRAADR